MKKCSPVAKQRGRPVQKVGKMGETTPLEKEEKCSPVAKRRGRPVTKAGKMGETAPLKKEEKTLNPNTKGHGCDLLPGDFFYIGNESKKTYQLWAREVQGARASHDDESRENPTTACTRHVNADGREFQLVATSRTNKPFHKTNGTQVQTPDILKALKQPVKLFCDSLDQSMWKAIIFKNKNDKPLLKTNDTQVQTPDIVKAHISTEQHDSAVLPAVPGGCNALRCFFK